MCSNDKSASISEEESQEFKIVRVDLTLLLEGYISTLRISSLNETDHRSNPQEVFQIRSCPSQVRLQAEPKIFVTVEVFPVDLDGIVSVWRVFHVDPDGTFHVPCLVNYSTEVLTKEGWLGCQSELGWFDGYRSDDVCLVHPVQESKVFSDVLFD